MTDRESLIGLIYEAAIEPAALNPLIAALVDLVGGSCGWMVEAHPDGMALPAAHNLNPELMRLYAEHYHLVDPWLIRGIRIAEPGRWLNMERAISTAEFRQSEIFHDLVLGTHTDVLHNICMPFDLSPHTIAIMRGTSHDPFGQAEERLLADLAPHLMRMNLIRTRVAGGVAATSDEPPTQATFHLDRDLRVIDLNGPARSLTHAGNLVQVGPDRRLTWTATNQVGLDHALRLCLRRAVPAVVRVTDGCAVPHRIHIAAGPPDARGMRVPAVSLIVRDLARAAAVQIAAAQRLFHLSPGEAALVESLLAERTLEEHAALRRSSRETTRKQLTGVFRKVGVSRQAALVAAIWTLPTA